MKIKRSDLETKLLINRKMAVRKRTTFEKCLEEDMTPAQREVFIVVDEWWKRFGCSPSIRDICNQRGVKSIGSTSHMVDRLIELGVLKKVKGKRSIRPVYINFRNVE